MKKILLILSVIVSTSALANPPKILVDTCNTENAKQGHQCWRLATAYRNEGDLKNAKKYYKKACSLGYSNGCNDYDFYQQQESQD